MPLINQIMVKESDILSILDQMRTVVPEEIKQARRILQERERILVQAQQDASDMLARSRQETEHVLSREGLLRRAEEHSQELVRRATEHSRELVRRAEEHTEQLQAGADAYVAETLRNLKDHLTSIQGELDHTLLSIEKGLESLEAQQLAQENLEDRAEVDDEQDNAPLSSGAVPHHASLARDTMGGPPTHQ